MTNMIRPSVLLMCLSLRTIAADANEWPEFRGPTTAGISTAKSVPMQWDSKSNVVWKVEVPGAGWSSPVVRGERIYLTSASNGESANQVVLHAFCFQAKDGKLVWNTEVFVSTSKQSQQKHGKNTLASPTPIVTKDRVYVHFGPMGTAALDLKGKVVWANTNIIYPPVHGNGGSPALFNGKLIFSCDGDRDPFVIGLDAGTGKELWRTSRKTTAKKNFSFCTPLVAKIDGMDQVILPGSGFVAGYNPSTGEEIWKVKYGEGYSVVPRPILAQGNLYIGTGFDRAWIYAIKAKGLKGDCSDTHVVWKEPKGAPYTPSMLIVGKELYAVSDSGIASCFDAATGKVYWSERLGGDFSASPVLVGDRIYFLSETGNCYVVKADPKEFKLLAKNTLGEKTLASPAVINGAVLIRSEGHLWRIGK